MYGPWGEGDKGKPQGSSLFCVSDLVIFFGTDYNEQISKWVTSWRQRLSPTRSFTILFLIWAADPQTLRCHPHFQDEESTILTHWTPFFQRQKRPSLDLRHLELKACKENSFDEGTGDLSLDCLLRVVPSFLALVCTHLLSSCTQWFWEWHLSSHWRPVLEGTTGHGQGLHQAGHWSPELSGPLSCHSRNLGGIQSKELF